MAKNEYKLIKNTIMDIEKILLKILSKPEKITFFGR